MAERRDPDGIEQVEEPALSPKAQGQQAALAGLIAPLLGVLLMVIIAVAVDVIIGVVIGAVATIAFVPITRRLLARRGPSNDG